jgi:chitodextrinase
MSRTGSEHSSNEGSSRQPRRPTLGQVMFGSRRHLAAAAGFWFLLLAAAAAISVIPGATASTETPVFSDGFESGDLSQWTGSSGMTVQQQVKYAGSWAARATTTGSPGYAYKRLSTPLNELYYDGRFDVITQGSPNVSLVRFRTANVAPILTIMRRANNRLAYYNELTGQTSIGPTVTAGVWHELEVHVLINGSASLIEVWLDGQRISALSKTDSLGATPVGRVYVGDPATGRTFDVAYDEEVVSSADSQPPSTPTGLTVTGNTLSSISLGWQASTDNVGVVGYNVFVNGTRIDSTTGTGYTFSGLACGTSYTLAVDAYDAAGNTSGQASVTASTASCGGPPPPDGIPPTIPTGLTVTDASQSTISLSWNASTDNVGVAGYHLFRNNSNVGTTPATNYTFSGLACGTSYSLGVDAYDAAGNVSGRATITAASSPCGGNVFYVSPTGSDSNPGTLTQPWRTIGKAMSELVAGQTAYLRAGVYRENVSGSCGITYNKLVWSSSGTANAPITISGYPGEANLVLVPTAIKLAGDYLHLQNMVVDRNAGWSTFDTTCDGGPSVNIFGSQDVMSGVEVRNSAMSGVYLENATQAQLTGNWIHDNGTHYNLDHGVYWCSGANGRIADNIVQHNFANGLKIGPNAQSVLVTQNTVNGNGRSGVIVSGDTTYKSNNNTVADNILTWNGWSSGGGFGLRTYWESAGVGTGNQAVRNLMYGNSNGDTWYPGGGMTETGSIFDNPLFANLATGDFHLQGGSPAVDTANSGYSTARDYAGAPRPQSAGPDLGAYER